MYETPFMEAIADICGKDPRYKPDAYFFVREALDFTSKNLNKPEEGPRKHISGRELLDGIRLFARQEFGPMTMTVLSSWGVTATEDFGEIVFNLVENRIFGKTPEDSRKDFAGIYDFQKVFAEPYLPRGKRAGNTRKAAGHEKSPV